MSTSGVNTTYLSTCLAELTLSARILKKLNIDTLADLEKEIIQQLQSIAKKMTPAFSPNLHVWLEGILHFEDGSKPPAITLTDEECQTIKVLFQDLLHQLFHRVAYRVDLLKLIFAAIDRWQREYNQAAQTGYRWGLQIRITVPEPNPFATENEVHYQKLVDLLWGLEQEIIPKMKWSRLSADAQFGAYLFFAITQSGVTQARQLTQLAQVSLQRNKMDEPFSGFLLSTDTKTSADVYSPKRMSESNGLYRWIPDPVTKRMFERYRRNWDALAQQNKHAGDYVNDFLSHLKSQMEVRPKKNVELDRIVKSLAHLTHLSYLFKASIAYQRRTLPSFIWHYLEGAYLTKDLEPASIERLHGFDYALGNSDTPKVKTQSIKLTGKDDTEVEEERMTIPEQMDWCQELVRILESDSSVPKKKILISTLRDSFATDSCRLIHLLSDWLIDSLDQGPDISRLVLYAKHVLPLLIANYELDEDFSEGDAAERAEELEELIAQLSSDNEDPLNEGHVREAWHALHLYLVASNRIRKEDYPQQKNPKAKVDAEYMSLREYRAVQVYLWTKDIPTRLKNQCLVIFTLAYRLGLRRSEVIKLATHHISYLDDAPDQLAVRWWKERRLKSPSSKRTLPIKGILSQQEFDWLHLMTLTRRSGKWLDEDLFSMDKSTLESRIQDVRVAYRYKRFQDAAVEPFSLPEESFLFIDDEKLVDARVVEIVNILHVAIRTTVGNPKLRLHHLRHSCAMNTLMLLLSPKLPHAKHLLLSMYFGNEKGVETFMTTLGKGAQALFNQSRMNQHTFEVRSYATRRALLNQDQHSSSEVYTTSRLLGHSSPKTTFASYIHLLPLLTSAFLYERFENYSAELQEALFPNHARTLDRYKQGIKEGKYKSLLEHQKLGRPFK